MFFDQCICNNLAELFIDFGFVFIKKILLELKEVFSENWVLKNNLEKKSIRFL